MNKGQNKSKNTKKQQRVKRQSEKKVTKAVAKELRQRYIERVHREELIELGFTIGKEDTFVFTKEGKRAYCKYCDTRLDILNIVFSRLPSTKVVFTHKNTECLAKAEVEAKLVYKKDKVMQDTYHVLK